MKNVYINGLGSVSAIDLSENSVDNAVQLKESVTKAAKVNYKEFISAGQIRRMSSSVKMGVYASRKALMDAGLETPKAIITGTGMGCLIDSEKFLTNILDNDEDFLTPTAFIQSTHNTVGGQVALGLKCNAYNVTYVHEALSFESALIDSLLKIQHENQTDVLLGGVDELSKITVELYQKIEHIKDEPGPINVLNSKTNGAVFSEGSQFVVLQNHKTKNSYAEIVDCKTIDVLDDGSIDVEMNNFLTENGIAPTDIDLVLTGYNGDVKFDVLYDSFVSDNFPKTTIGYYKHLVGEYNTVSSFGLQLGADIIKSQTIPSNTIIQKGRSEEFKNVLIYNQYRGNNHSFTLLKQC